MADCTKLSLLASDWQPGVLEFQKSTTMQVSPPLTTFATTLCLRNKRHRFILVIT